MTINIFTHISDTPQDYRYAGCCRGCANKKIACIYSAKKQKLFSVIQCTGEIFEVYNSSTVVKGTNPSWFGFPILVREDAPFSRSEIVKFLEDHKIATVRFLGEISSNNRHLNE
jgi:hypothetical protein